MPTTVRFSTAPFQQDDTNTLVSIELKHLRYAEVAERCGSFRKAADLLAIKQSNLNRRVRHLEEQLGVVLFERTNGGVRPTLAGRGFVNGVRRILEELQILIESSVVASNGRANVRFPQTACFAGGHTVTARWPRRSAAVIRGLTSVGSAKLPCFNQLFGLGQREILLTDGPGYVGSSGQRETVASLYNREKKPFRKLVQMNLPVLNSSWEFVSADGLKSPLPQEVIWRFRWIRAFSLARETIRAPALERLLVGFFLGSAELDYHVAEGVQADDGDLASRAHLNQPMLGSCFELDYLYCRHGRCTSSTIEAEDLRISQIL